MQQTKKIDVRAKKLMNSLFVGNFKAAFHGKGIEFQDFRQYAPGDDAKYIDWLVSSREWSTIMRRYREDKQGKILCIVDESNSLQNSKIKSDITQEIISLLSSASLASGESFGWYRISKEGVSYISPKKSQVSINSFLTKRESYTRTENLNIDFLLKNPLKKSIIFVISDSLDIDVKSFTQGAFKHDLIYLHVSEHFENTLEWFGIQRVGRGRLSFGINLDDIEKKAVYQRKRKEKLKKFAKAMRSIGWDIAFFDESQSVFARFLGLMKSRKK